MTVASLQNWKDSFAEIELVVDQTWKNNLGSWMSDNTSGMKLAGYSPSNKISYSFNSSSFAASLPDSDKIPVFSTALATAWEAGVLASTLTITPPMSSPAWTAITSVTVDPASISVGKGLIQAMVLAPVETARESPIIPPLRSAFLSLTYTVIGVIGGQSTTLPAQGVV